jgi:hypothetical protein
MTTTTDPLLDPLRREIMGSLLRYQVGQQIFCPGATCGGAVLDWRRALGIGSNVVCTACWAGLGEGRQQAVLEAAETNHIELLDGPALSGGDPVLVRAVDPELEARRPGPGQMELL